MASRDRRALTWGVWVFLLCCHSRADEVSDRAAQLFQGAVAAFERGDFAAAGRDFLEADRLAPNDDALGNALVATKKAGDHLMTAEVSERILARQTANPALKNKARLALSAASQHLARVNLGCRPAPCRLSVDGEPAPPGRQYLLPGDHQLLAIHDSQRLSRTVSVAAGRAYRWDLEVPPPTAATPATPATGAPDASERPTTSADKPAEGAGESSDKPLSPTVFWIGVAATSLGAVATAVSGIDAVSAKSDLGDRPTTDEVSKVEGKVRRTDVLFGVSLLFGAATAYAGVFQVDWGGPDRQGLGLSYRRAF